MGARKAGRPPVKRNAATLEDDIRTLLRLKMSVEAYDRDTAMGEQIVQKIDALVGDLRIKQLIAA